MYHFLGAHFSMTYYKKVRMATPIFCASCPEIQFAYDTWKTSTHVNNAHGFYELKKRCNNFMEDGRYPILCRKRGAFSGQFIST
jgi:nitrate/TMAO reductase-like tetraheme cytochrome c subunit